MTEIITSEALAALLQVVMIDLVLAGDNAVVIGLAAAGLAPEQRKRAIIIGIVAATILRIILATIATQLLQEADEMLVDRDPRHEGTVAGRLRRKSFSQAAVQIVVADISMSLDNVL